MNSDSPLNIFQSSAKKVTKSSEKTRGRPQLPIITGSMSPAVAAMMEKMQEMQADLDVKVEEAARRCHVTKEELWEFIGNRANFSEAQWKVLQAEKEAYRARVYAHVDKATTVNSNSIQTSSERKAKLIGSRRKWISTR